MTKNHMGTVEERFWRKVERGPDCWAWLGATTGPEGRGISYHEDRRMVAPRVSWIITYGPIPEGMLVCHRCDNPNCVRPDHLFLGSSSANAQDAGAKGRLGTGKHATHCKRGHLFDDFRHPKTGRRMCHTCHIERARRWRETQSERRSAVSAAVVTEAGK